MAREHPRWIRVLLSIAALNASEAELGDVMEEYAGGQRNALWLIRQLASTWRKPRPTTQEGRVEMLSNLWNDVRYAVRMLRRNPGFAAAALVPIALGIGVNTGMFSVFNSVAFRPLPTPQSTELVTVYQDFQGVQKRRVHGARAMFSMPEYRTYRDGTSSLSGVMAYSMPRTYTLEAGSSPQEIEGVLVTCNYFDVLRLRPALGTGFTSATCDAPNAPPVVILSHALWTRAFAADPAIVQKTITLNGQSVGVIGVAPEGFDGVDMTKTTVFVPTTLLRALHPERDFHEDPHTSWLTLVGRRKPGTGLSQARADLAVIASQIDQQQPGRTTTLSVAPTTYLTLPFARHNFLSAGAVVLAAFGLLLLIACANVANVLLARAAGRTKEIAVRLSVGASRARLVQQLLTESVIIALAGGVAGSLLAWWSFQSLLAGLLPTLPDVVPLRLDARPDPTVLWFALGLTLATALLCGLVPALHASKHDVNAVLKHDVAGAGSGGVRAGWVKGTLISIQVALCMVLLILAGLFARALHAAQTIDPGFDYRGVAIVSFSLRQPASDAARTAFQQQAMERIGALPGVDAVAQVARTPLSRGRTQTEFRLPNREEWHEVDINMVSPGYFSLIRIPIVRGRTFTAADLAGPPRAAIVTEATARRYWPGQDPIGRTIAMKLNQDAVLEIVGVARDAQVGQMGVTESSYMYLPAAAGIQRQLALLVRSQTDFTALATSVRGVMRELDPSLVVRMNTLEQNLEYWRTGSRVIAGLSGSLSLLAIALASVGVYGVVSYVVSRRRREVGIRMALGASDREVQGLILSQTLRPVAVGVLTGLAGAAGASQLLRSALFGISPFDPIAFIGAVLLLVGVAVAASLLPTREALKGDPMSTLRYE